VTTRLTAKQARFVDEYLVDLNATQAAIRAGYSERTADKIASEALRKPAVAAAVAEGKVARAHRTGITQDYVLATIFDTVERCRQASPVLDRAGKQVYVETPTGELAPAYAFDAKAVLRGCELLGKHLGLFAEKVQLTGADGGPVQVAEVPLDNIQKALERVRSRAAKPGTGAAPCGETNEVKKGAP